MLLIRQASLRRIHPAYLERTLVLPTRSIASTAYLARERRQQALFGSEPASEAEGGSRGGRGGRAQQPNRGFPRAPVQRLSVDEHVAAAQSAGRSRSLRPHSLTSIIADRLDQWIESDAVADRLEAFGFERSEAQDLLSSWSQNVQEDLQVMDKDDDGFLTRMNAMGWDAQTLTLAYELGEGWSTVFEAAFYRHFLEFSIAQGPQHLQLHLKALLQATDLSDMRKYMPARTVNRHFHLHMGPTNSGKTYNALKALASAGSGVYAGPLRLLAHEVWERLNLGTVGGLDGKGRPCSLLTGEERRIVENGSNMVSCTVEMLPLHGSMDGKPWDVVVIDEIQMMGDAQRGGAWTNAVMGANAKEIHLCGDETTADLLKSMISGFKGDQLTVHKYERLTPLNVADESLDGDWKKIEPGDCVVTFSRSSIFGVKKSIEGELGKKCAVVYGALPPEVRAEQARDFNEPSGRAEVMVASDAVGMGLNLKINRIVFESLVKYDGTSEVPLSLSQVKQIAGRAGRFGQQRKVDDGSDATTDEVAQPGGIVTTLHKADLPLLRAMMPLSLPSVSRAVVELPRDALGHLAPLLPPSTTFEDLISHFNSLAKLPPNTVMSQLGNRSTLAEAVENYRDQLTLNESMTFSLAPVNHRDAKVMGIFQNILAAYCDTMHVDLEQILYSSTLLRTLKTVEETLAALPPLPPHLGIFRKYLAPPITIAGIPLLESLHKSLVLYLWLSYRFELAFPDRELAAQYKERTEHVLEICLERLPGVRSLKREERTKDMDREHAIYRRKYVDKHGLVKPDIQWVQREQAARESRRSRFGMAEQRQNPLDFHNDGEYHNQSTAHLRTPEAARRESRTEY